MDQRQALLELVLINNVETWNGSSWSEIAEINSIKNSNAMSAGGTSTSVIYFGGNASPGVQALNEEWNGSSWSEEADLNTGRSYLTGMGTSAAIAVGGSTTTAALNHGMVLRGLKYQKLIRVEIIRWDSVSSTHVLSFWW